MGEDLESLGLNLTFDNIARMSQDDLKNRVKMAVISKAYTYLTEMQQKHSKSMNLVYSELKLQDYLCSDRSARSISDKARLFQIRSRMLDLKSNFKVGKENILCTLCDGTNKESQPHLLVCEALTSTSVIS